MSKLIKYLLISVTLSMIGGLCGAFAAIYFSKFVSELRKTLKE